MINYDVFLTKPMWYNEKRLKYSGKLWYQYNEDDLNIKVLIVNKLFSNYKVTIVIKDPFLTYSFTWLLCLCVSMLFSSLLLIKI